MKYDAFISYRHSELDLYIAKKIHKGLETLKVPYSVAKKTGKKKIKRVFRDQEELPIGSDLGDKIEGALAKSEFLIVICSPRTPKSDWVQKEISTFIKMHGRERILAVLIEGEPNESFPKLLLTDDKGNPVEPLAADVRGESKAERKRKLKTEMLRLAAPILNCSYDDLKQRHRERQMKKIGITAGAIAVAGVAFGAYSTYNATLIQQNYEEKQRNQSKYLAETSLRLLEEGDRRAAVLVALEALPSKENEKPYVAEAQYALSQALYCYDMGNQIKMDCILPHELPVADFYVDNQGTRAASVDRGGTIYVWDLERGTKLSQIAPRVDENGYLIDILDIILYEDHIVVCETGDIRSFDMEGQEEWAVQTTERTLYCEYNETTLVLACVNNNEAVFYDIRSGKEIGMMQNSQESFFGGDIAFNKDGTKFAIAHFSKENENGYISVYDFETQKVTGVEKDTAFVADVAFTNDDCLAVAQIEYQDAAGGYVNIQRGFIEKIDWKNQSILWRMEYRYHMTGLGTTGSIIKCRNYQSPTTGEGHDEIILSVDNVVYTWDAKTGEQIGEVAVTGGIKEMLIATNTGYGYLVQNNGTIDAVNLTSGVIYTDLVIETGKSIQDLKMKNGVVVFCSYESPNLTVMRYPDEADKLEITQYENAIREMCYSENETYYAVRVYDYDVENHVYFYETEGDKLLTEWIEEGESTVLHSFFVDDNVYVAACMDGTIMFYDMESGEKQKLITDEIFGAVNYDFNKSNNLALAYNYNQYALIDLQQRMVLAKGSIDGTLDGAILSEDGKRAFCSFRDDNMCILDIETGTVMPIEQSEYRVLNSIKAQNALAVNGDGSLLAVSCRDGKLRVLDVNEMETVAEIPFSCVNRIFIEFSRDGSKLLMQGDDYYLRVYDLEKKTFVYIATNQYREIQDIIEDENLGTISLVTTDNIIILNAHDYERIARIEGGESFFPQNEMIYSKNGTLLYAFPYMTLEMLQEETKEQFGDESLTELEKIKYYIE